MLTGIPVSEFTSLGCHTALWNYTTRQYDDWVTKEKIDVKLAPLVSTFTSINSEVSGKKLMIGTGIHDSSSALLPYLTSVKKSFILISTGTWCVSLNPFSLDKLTAKDIANGCLYYMTTEGSPVLAHRLFLGFEFELQVNKLAMVYQTTLRKIQKIKYDQDIVKALQNNDKRYFQFAHLGMAEQTIQNLPKDFDLKTAYHQLMGELVERQLISIKSILKNAPIKKIIIDGGFAKNNLYLKMLAGKCKPMVIYANRTPAGSALGAGIALKPEWWSGKWMKSNLKLKKIK
jgi:sugar (pentulose or hexulose) kinase